MAKTGMKTVTSDKVLFNAALLDRMLRHKQVFGVNFYF
ncbi:hypothetical protein JCM19240_6448 [Vibrio maritimus]|uniref:Uncharacterized protein n=1 Tax=Vibrio maritimus TaxID=990268 RepID=A0A090SZF1_9VIBR|nr:hypothetical protein JCM19240_6448 [Vibrio maritimus]